MPRPVQFELRWMRCARGMGACVDAHRDASCVALGGLVRPTSSPVRRGVSPVPSNRDTFRAAAVLVHLLQLGFEDAASFVGRIPHMLRPRGSVGFFERFPRELQRPFRGSTGRLQDDFRKDQWIVSV